MPLDYNSIKVKCPFYKEETRNTIKCEGVFSSTCSQNFRDSLYKKRYKEKYCNKNYYDCEHFKNVNHKYPLKKTTR